MLPEEVRWVFEIVLFIKNKFLMLYLYYIRGTNLTIIFEWLRSQALFNMALFLTYLIHEVVGVFRVVVIRILQHDILFSDVIIILWSRAEVNFIAGLQTVEHIVFTRIKKPTHAQLNYTFKHNSLKH
jgi:hypothetical protein